MTEDEAIEILALVVAGDRRTVGKADIMLWSEALKDVNHQDAADAVMNHVRTSMEWLTPAHILRRVREVHRARLEAAKPGPDFPSHEDGRELSQVEERNYRALWNEQIRSGATPEQATAQTDTLLGHKRGELVSKPVAAALESMFSTGRRS